MPIPNCPQYDGVGPMVEIILLLCLVQGILALVAACRFNPRIARDGSPPFPIASLPLLFFAGVFFAATFVSAIWFWEIVQISQHLGPS